MASPSCGAKVFLCDVDPEALAACPHPSMPADMERVEGCEGFVDAAVAHLGGLDVLVNNAGIAGPTARVEDVTPEALTRTLKIDFGACSTAPAARCRPAGGGRRLCHQPLLRRRPLRLSAAQPLCRGEMGRDRLHQVARDRTGAEGIRVNAILPGLVAGDRIRRVLEAKAQANGRSFAEQEAEALKPSRCAATSRRRISPTWRSICAAPSARQSAARRSAWMATCSR